jgi:PAS domain-containing protein/HPt (histidine-containing phosphotransfer) domain-containing protein
MEREGSGGRTSKPSGRFLSIGTKLGFGMLVVVLVASALVFIQLVQRDRESLVAAKRTAADMVADLFAASLGAPLDFGDEDAVKAELDNLAQNREVSYAAVWQGDSKTPLRELHAGAAPPERPITPGTTVTTERVECVRQVRGGEKKDVGIAVVHFSLASENAAYSSNRQRIFILCLSLALGTMVLLIALTRRQIVRPLETLLHATRDIERGKRVERIATGTHDEIGRLATAFDRMNAAIFEREQQLAEAHHDLRELFDHMRQAILVFGPEGLVERTASKQAARVFGSDNLTGRRVQELLYPDAGDWDAELRAFDEWCGLAFGIDIEAWERLEPLAPRDVRIQSKTVEHILLLEFRPIVNDGVVERVMLLATDETDKRRLERQFVEQGERHARQMAVMRRLVSGGGRQLVGFLETARVRIQEAGALIGDRKEMSADDVEKVFRHVHTLKGEARAFQLEELSSLLDGLEERLVELREQAKSAPASLEAIGPDLRSGFGSALTLLEQAEDMLIQASPLGRAVLDQVTVSRTELGNLMDVAEKLGGEFQTAARRLVTPRFGEIASRLAEQAPGWAASENRSIRLEIDGQEIGVAGELGRVLGGVLTHLVRNSIAHGIESSDERVAAGKPKAGLLLLRAHAGEREGAPVLSIEDDGAGIPSEGILAKAADDKTPLSYVATTSFRPTESGKHSTLAGRGVGLTAAVEDLARADYAIWVERREPHGTRFLLKPRPTRGP